MNAHIIKYNEGTILFLPNSYKFFEINDDTENLIKDIEQKIDKNSIVKKYGIDEEEYREIYELVMDEVTPEYITEEQGNALYKLAIHIVNGCNLDCVYCYANAGTYKSQKEKMTEETLLKTLEVFFDHFEYIGAVQLFGGEPTLNLSAIETVGEYIDSKYKSGEIKTKPIICMTTNGMCASDQFIKIINKYKIQLTVSIDGPKSIVNKTRLDKMHRGIADILETNIKKLQEKTGQPKSAEVTFTQYHLEERISVYDTIHYLREKFGFEDIHIAPVSAKETDPYNLDNRNSFFEAISEFTKSQEPGYMLANRVACEIMQKKVSKQICGAGKMVYSVSTKGDIYPCFMFTDIKKFKLGNVYEINDNFWENKGLLMEKFSQYNRLESEQCKDCFNKNICHGCMGNNYYSTNNPFKSSERECEFMKNLTENVIVALIEGKKMRK